MNKDQIRSAASKIRRELGAGIKQKFMPATSGDIDGGGPPATPTDGAIHIHIGAPRSQKMESQEESQENGPDKEKVPGEAASDRKSFILDTLMKMKKK